MSTAYWKDVPPRSNVDLIRKAFADEFQTWPFSVVWRQANWYDVVMFPPSCQPKDQRHYSYLVIDGKAVRQN